MITKKACGSTIYCQRGFTLLELVVVLGIIALLTAIVVPNFGTFFGRGETEVCEMEEQLVKTLTVVYASENAACPSSIDELNPYMEDPVDIMGSYNFGSTYPDCTVSQDSCP